MNTFITGDIWSKINRHLRAKVAKQVSIAYVTQSSLKLGRGDELVCDASEAAIKGGMTSAKVLREYYTRGVTIYSNRALHAKFLVTDDILVIGSANLSQSSSNMLIETALITQDKKTISQAKAFFYQLTIEEPSTQILDIEHIERLLKIRVNRPVVFKGRTPKITKSNFGENAWFLDTYPLGDRAEQLDDKIDDGIREELIKENQIEEDSITCTRWPLTTFLGKSAKVGDRLIVCSNNREGNRRKMLPPSTILKKIKKGRYAYFYYTEDDARAISFTEFKEKYKSSFAGNMPFKRNGLISSDLLDKVSTIWK